LGEAKANGNIGNTLKVLGQFDEALHYCQQHLKISTQLSDKVETTSFSFSCNLVERPAVVLIYCSMFFSIVLHEFLNECHSYDYLLDIIYN
jgi:hypothetical protein